MKVNAEPVDVSFGDILNSEPSTITVGCKRQRAAFDGGDSEVPGLRSLRQRVDLKPDAGGVPVSKEIEAQIKGLKNVCSICPNLMILLH